MQINKLFMIISVFNMIENEKEWILFWMILYCSHELLSNIVIYSTKISIVNREQKIFCIGKCLYSKSTFHYVVGFKNLNIFLMNFWMFIANIFYCWYSNGFFFKNIILLSMKYTCVQSYCLFEINITLKFLLD